MKDRTRKRRERVVEKLSRYIGTHLNEKLRLRELAYQVRFSERYCRRAFLAVTGETIGRRVRRLRVELAANAVSQEKPVRVAEAAAKSGYATVEGLSRAVRRELGSPPATLGGLNRDNPVNFPVYDPVTGQEPIGHAEVGINTSLDARTTYVYDGGRRTVIDTGNKITTLTY